MSKSKRAPRPSKAEPPQVVEDALRVWTLIGWEMIEFRSNQLRKGLQAMHRSLQARDTDQLIDLQSRYWESVAQDYVEEVERLTDLWDLAVASGRSAVPMPSM